MDITMDNLVILLGVLFGLGFIGFGIFVWALRKENAANNAQPVRKAVAKIVDKQQIQPGTIAFEAWILFETEDGNRVRVMGKANNDYVIGDSGDLKWQGNRLIAFIRKIQ